MPTPDIIRGRDFMFPIIYEGNASGQRVGKFVSFTNNGTIAKSCIFNDGDTPALSRTLSGDGNKKKFTISVWVKRCVLAGDYTAIVVGGGTSGSSAGIFFNSSQQLYIYLFGAEALKTNRTFEDTSKWYHIVLRVDSSDSTADDRVRLYIDGVQETSFATRNNPSQDAQETLFNVNAKNIDLGRHTTSTYYYDGYMAEVNFADGQSYGPDTFGITDTSTGRWIPKSLTGITYGTNGFRMEFANSAGQTIGDDTSGQGNDKTVVNLATTDLTTDSPTQNFPTFDINRNLGTKQTTEDGGLTIYASSASGYTAMAADKEIPQSGKWYWEVKLVAVGSVQGITNPTYGVIDRNIKEINNFDTGSEIGRTVGGMGATFWSGFKFSGLNSTAVDFTIGSHTAATNDYVVFAFDMDDGKAWWGFKDGSADLVWYANDGGTDGNPGAGTNPTVTFNPKDHRFVPIQQFYAPGSGYSARYHYNFGQKAFAFTAPTGFGKLSQENYPTTSKGIVDFAWVKDRDSGDYSNMLVDSSRGVRSKFNSNSSNPSSSQYQDEIQKFLAGGFAVEDSAEFNRQTSYVAWNWVANNATTGSSTNSTIQTNSTAKFSIVQWNGTGSDQNIGHGLGVKPDTIWCKNVTENSATGSGVSWRIWQKDAISLSSDSNTYLRFDSDDSNTASGDSWGDTAPTTSVFTVGADVHTNASVSGGTATYIAYCFANQEGYFKTGRYVGNSAANGSFVHLGFKPSWLMIKAYNLGSSWHIWDSTRNPINPITNNAIFPDTAAAEGGTHELDLLSNGFKLRSTENWVNNSSYTYLYWAFAENPFIGDGVNPTTAR